MSDPGGPWTLWGLPHSLYTGPVRAYLRKAGVPFIERSPHEAAFAADVVPRLGRVIIPVVTRGEEVVQDSVDIIDRFEAAASTRAYPTGPRQRLLAVLFQLYGNQGLLRHAMHYRWSHYPAQARFLDHAFGLAGQDERAARTMARMQSYLPGLGVTQATAPLIERSFEELLDALDAHLTGHPYLFGGRASVGDLGLLGPLFAHLGRDPVPSDLMKRRAPAVFRWVERMNAPDADLVDFAGVAPDFLPGDAVPPTLEPLVAHMGVEMADMFADSLDYLAQWVAEHDPADGSSVGDKPAHRALGMTPSRYRGEPVKLAVAPYLLYLVQRVRREIEALPPADRAWARELLSAHRLWEPLTRMVEFGVERRDHIEVWSRGSHRIIRSSGL